MATEINIEEHPAKVVGRRRAPAHPLRSSRDTRRDAEAWSRAFPRPFVPRGVYRFRTHQEADAWMWSMISFAMRAAGYIRRTMGIDLLIATGPANEARVFKALESLPDRAVRELQPGEVALWAVVRVADEIVVDLLRAAGGVEYGEAGRDVDVHEIDGVAIPFASPRLLWRTKRSSLRDKDKPDLQFLRLLFQQSGQPPPD